MKSSLQAGIAMTRQIIVDPSRTVGFMGEDARVYGTPLMIMDVEKTCRDLIMEHTDAGEDSVGIEVGVKHLAATLPGMTVEITVRVASVEGRKILADHLKRLLGDAKGAAVRCRADHAGAGQPGDHLVESLVHAAGLDDLVADQAALRAVAFQPPLVLDRLARDAVADRAGQP